MFVRLAVAVAGGVVVLATLMAALKTVVVPRAYGVMLTKLHFRALHRVLKLFASPQKSFDRRDRVLALFAPLALVTLPISWIVLVGAGFAAIFWGAGVDPWSEALAASGSSIFTLGFLRPEGTGRVLLAFVEAGIGLGLVSLMISYLPTIYGSFSRREALVGMLEVRAGLPPSPAELLTRYARIGWIDRLHDDLFEPWERWFVDVEESHTSHTALVFFRSPHPRRSWVTAAGCVLDSAAITNSTIDIEHDARADVMLRSGFFALRRIADAFNLVHPRDPSADDPISITRREFDLMCVELKAAGVPLKADLDQAWSDFAGWRVNYDSVLVQLSQLVESPPGKWTSDRELVDGE